MTKINTFIYASFACVALLCSFVCKAEEKADTSAVTLDEIEITGRKEINKGEYVQLYLSKQNEEFGINALESISSLNRFATGIGISGLSTLSHESVFILINGVPSTGDQLKQYSSKDIKYVEYYTFAPSKYAIFTTGALVNVVTRRPHDVLYQAQADLRNDITSLFGVNSVSGSVTDSLNRVNVSYGMTYNNPAVGIFSTGGIKSEKKYNYGDIVQSLYTTDNSKFAYTTQWASASYQRFQGCHMFNANVSYSWSRTHISDPTDITLTSPTTTATGVAEQDILNKNQSITADLYYMYFKGARQFAVNMVNYFGKSSSDNSLWQQLSGDAIDDSYSITNNIKNDIYSLIANAYYTQPLFGGGLGVSALYTLTRLQQSTVDIGGLMTDNTTHKYLTYTHKGQAHAGIGWNISNWSIYPYVGIRLYQYKNDTYTSPSTAKPIGGINAKWSPQGVMSGFSIFASAAIGSSMTGATGLTESITYLDRSLDRYFILTGNSKARSSLNTKESILISYYFPDGRNALILRGSAYYTPNYWASVLRSEGNVVYQQTDDIGKYQHYSMLITGTVYPFKWFEVSPYIEYYDTSYSTFVQKIHDQYWRYGGGITFLLRSWEFSLSANAPYHILDGDLKRVSPAQYGATVRWKHRNWSLGLYWNYQEEQIEKGYCPGFSFDKRTMTSNKNTFMIQFSYNFRKGKARQHIEKTFSHSIDETGILYNPSKQN